MNWPARSSRRKDQTNDKRRDHHNRDRRGTAAPAKKAATSKKNAPKPKKTAKAAKPTKPAKKAAQPAAERTNKKPEVIVMMKRAKGVTLAEIMDATGWQKRTARGFVSILGSKGGETIESSKNADRERTYKIVK
jgi:cytochrome c5